MRQRFHDRREAGQLLGAHLRERDLTDPIVLGLPRGGVVVAAEVAAVLGAPLDVILVRKLGVPFQPELAMGAVSEGGVRILDEFLIRAARINEAQLQLVEERERRNLAEAADRFRQGRSPLDLNGKTAILVDDGIATGATAHAAALVARTMGAARVVVAAPVASPEAVVRLREVADDVVVLSLPAQLLSISQSYDDFAPTSDHEVVALLAESGV
ncbi:MAG TPA: phosphoribosyltransferase family protein [Acidimicrobiia bacterium]|jgi:predicted phosphoribosyltransferase